MVILEGGSDTTAAFLQSLVLMLAAHPEIMLKAQKEIDGVVGDSRLPEINDIEQCPYISAIIKEVGPCLYAFGKECCLTVVFLRFFVSGRCCPLDFHMLWPRMNTSVRALSTQRPPI